jgi:ADP-ribose pyrophosphatase YjhB (NUDIX family)
MPREYPERPILAVAAVVLRGGEVLLIRRAREPGRGLYSLPGGAVRAGERLAEAAAREVLEETGLAVRVGPLITLVERVTLDEAGRARFHYVIADFLAEPLSGEPRASGDADDAAWADAATLGGYPVTEGLAEVVAAALKMSAG